MLGGWPKYMHFSPDQQKEWNIDQLLFSTEECLPPTYIILEMMHVMQKLHVIGFVLTVKPCYCSHTIKLCYCSHTL